MIKAWPGVPAIVTYSPESGWSVGTDPKEYERWFVIKARADSQER